VLTGRAWLAPGLDRKEATLAAWDELRRSRPEAFALVASEYADARWPAAGDAARAPARARPQRNPGIDLLRALATLDPPTPPPHASACWT
jgi:hypothetical protein